MTYTNDEPYTPEERRERRRYLIDAGETLAELREEQPDRYDALDDELDGRVSAFQSWYDMVVWGPQPVDDIDADIDEFYKTIDLVDEKLDDIDLRDD